MAQLWTEDPAMVGVYDIECAARHDHDFYLCLADEVGATSVVDVGCGTGVFAVDVAASGRRVLGVDPSGPMLDVARDRPGGASVEWIHGHADDVATGTADLVVMMGHVAQYFVADEAWIHVLEEIHRVLRVGGHLTFETRNPAMDWAHRWTRERTTTTYDYPDGGEFTSWVDVVDRSGSTESYSMTHEGHKVLPDGRHLKALETLRFRSRSEILAGLAASGFELEQSWGDWDRSPVWASAPEFILLATRR